MVKTDAATAVIARTLNVLPVAVDGRLRGHDEEDRNVRALGAREHSADRQFFVQKTISEIVAAVNCSGVVDAVINELDVVALTKDWPSDGLSQGDVGTVVHVHGAGEAFEVEFVALDGETIALLTLPADAVRPVRPREIAHVREVA